MVAVALIVAAGRGERLGSGRPKALVTLAGRPMLDWSVAALQAVAGGAADRRRAARRRARRRAGRHASRSPAAQPARSRCARRCAPRGAGDPVIVHDAARPLAQPELFVRALAELEQLRRRRRDRRGAGRRHDQGGRRRTAAPSRARSTARGCGPFRRRRCSGAPRSSAPCSTPPTSCSRGATDDAWLIERAGGVVRRRAVGAPRTSRSRRRPTCRSPSCCWRER